ncbi:MAG TPA: cytochrome P450 [Candidatus Dormibacteraeota bacterium]
MIGEGPAGCPVEAGFDPLAPEFLAEPMATLAALPPECRPLFYAPELGHVVVTGHAEIDWVLRHPELFSAANVQLPLVPIVPAAREILQAGGHRPQPSMVSLDPPAHGRLRRPAARAFTPRRVAGMTGTIRQTAAELLDAVGAEDRVELVAALAHPLPASVIFALLGLPRDDWPQLKRWCGARAELTWGRPRPEVQIDIATNMAAYRGYLGALVEARAGERADDLTGDLLAIHAEDPDQLTLAEITSILFSLTFAGHETTTGLIGNAVRRLLERPERWVAVAADAALVEPAVDETLRYDTSVPAWRRVTTTATTVAGVELAEGTPLLLWIAASNRDPAVFATPDSFDLHRADGHRALSFGRGAHFCLGAALGRLEARIALEELVRRRPGLRLVPGREVRFAANISFRGPLELWVEGA